MIKFERTETYGWEAAIRGMRNPKNSWDRSDSEIVDNEECGDCHDISGNIFSTDHFGDININIGPNDFKLMKTLNAGGPVHAKYRRMITVTVDITAPLYWWKEFDTYKVGTVANSCSTMHKISDKEFTLDDFSHEHLYNTYSLYNIVTELNAWRELYLETKDKNDWWQMIQLLPTSYNQKRTVMLNYEVLSNIYKSRKNHKLDEWNDFCDWIKELPYHELITGPDFLEKKMNIPISTICRVNEQETET